MKAAYIERPVAPGVTRGRRHHDIDHAVGQAQAKYEEALDAGQKAKLKPTISGEYITPLGDVFDFSGPTDPVKRHDLQTTARAYIHSSGRGGTPDVPADRVSHSVTANLISGVPGATMLKELCMLADKKVVEVDYTEEIDPKLFQTRLRADTTLVARHTQNCSAEDLESLQAWQSGDPSKLLVFEMEDQLVFNPFNGPKNVRPPLKAWPPEPDLRVE